MSRIFTPRFPENRPAAAAPSATEFVRTGRAAKRRKQLQRQRERETRTSLFLARVPSAYIAFDAAGRILDWNVRAAALFGWLGQSRRRPTLAQIIVRESAVALKDLLAHWPPATEGQRRELTGHHRTGTAFPVELAVSLVQEGPPPLYGALIEDISPRRRTEQIADLLSETSAALASVDDVHDAAGRFLATVMARLDADYAAIWCVEPASRRMLYAVGRSSDDAGMVAFDRLSRRTAFNVGIGLPGRVVAEGAGIWVPDILNEDNFPRIGGALRAGLRSGFGVPVRHGGRVIGAVEVFKREVGHGDAIQLRWLTALGDQVGLVIDGLTARLRRNDA